MDEMKTGKKTFSKITLAALCSALLQGCVTDMLFPAPPPAIPPSGWAPKIPDELTEIGSPPTGSRPMREKDAVIVRVRAGVNVALNMEGVINELGNITLEYLGDFKISQMTTSEAQTAIRNAYVNRGFLIDPTVAVICTTIDQIREVFLAGEVVRKSNYPYRDGLTMLQLIISAGDVTPFASREARLTRNGITEIHDLKKIRDTKAPDPILFPNDRIEVMRSMW